MPSSVGPNTKGQENLVFGYDLGDTRNSYKGEPTTNIVPSPEHNGSFTTSNGWGTYNTNQYNSNTYFSIGTVGSISDNIVTLSSVGHTIRSFDVLTPETTGGGLTAGTRYVIKKLSSNTFSLHEYNSSQNGSQGYINPDTGFFKVHDAYANDTRISINVTNFPTSWWGPPHLPNSGLIKEVVEGIGNRTGTNVMRLHVYRGDGVADGMAYNVYCPVTVGDTITVSYYQRAATPTAVGKTLTYSTYFGPGKSAYGTGVNCGEFMEWNKVVHQWTSSATFSFYSYFFPQGASSKYAIDLADFQVEVNKGHATPFVAGTRSATQGLIDLTGNSTIDLTNASFDSNAQMTFDGTDDRVDLGNLSDLFIPGAKAITVEAVFKITPGASGNAAPIFENYRFNFWYSYSNDKINGYVRTGAPDTAGYQTATGHTSTIACSSKGNYNHVVMMYETIRATEGRITMYVNGQYAGSSEGLRMGPYPLYPTWIGQSYHGGYGTYKLNGQVGVMRVYNRALTASEIKANYNAIKGRFNI